MKANLTKQWIVAVVVGAGPRPMLGRAVSLVFCVGALLGNARAVHAEAQPCTWGDNDDGQLGDGTTMNSSTPLQVTGLSGVTAIAGELENSLALKNDGTVWAWGRTSSTPVQVTGLSGVTAIAARERDSLALKNDGTVWAWGDNEYGQLGNGTTTGSGTPVQATGLSGITAIAAGYCHSLALKNDGTVWAWGCNQYGQLGDGTTTNSSTPVQVTGLSGATAIGGGGRLGFGHSLAVKNDGTVWAWGGNSNGQLGDGTTTQRLTPVQVTGLSGVTAIAAGGWGWGGYSLALKNDGTVSAWGYNSDGQLGDGTSTTRYTPVQVTGLTNVTAIAGGCYHSLALKSDGTVWAWGRNVSGQLGDGTFTGRTEPVQVAGLTGVTAIGAGVIHSLAVGTAFIPRIASVSPAIGPLAGGTPVTIGGSNFATSGTITVSFGPNAATNVTVNSAAQITCTTPVGSAGVVDVVVANPDGHSGTRTGAFAYGGPPAITDISPSSGPTAGGTPVTISGSNFGFGTGAPVTVSFGPNAATNVTVNSGTQITFTTPAGSSGRADVVVTNPGSQSATWPQAFRYFPPGTQVYAWGDNAWGQLGDGTTTERDTPVQVAGLNGMTAIAGGWAHSLAVMNDGMIWAWGLNNEGQLGDDTTTERDTPVRVFGNDGVTAIIAAGGWHSLASYSDPLRGSYAIGWGWNGFGQLGDGTTTGRDKPSSNLWGYSAAIAGGGYHSLAMKVDLDFNGTVYAWGRNNHGQLGDGTTTDNSMPNQVPGLSNVTVAIAAGWEHSLALKNDGTVWAWGSNSNGQLGDGTTTDSSTPVQVAGLWGVTAIAGGYWHSLALRNDGTVWAWGLNDCGQLGDGTTTDSSTPVQVTGLSGVTAIAGGGWHSLARKNSGTLWAWGSNSNGQLGDGTTTERDTPVQVTGLGGVTAIGAGQYHSLALGMGPAPTISSLWPTSGPTAGGTAVTITGSAFATSGTVTVRFGSNAATNVTVNSATQITCTTPAGSAGAVDVTVTNPDSQSGTKTGAFTYIAPLSISSLWPTSGPTAGGTGVTITGSAFATSGTVTVKFGSNAATNVTANSATQITCITPAGSAGAVDVVVTNPDSQSATLTGAFTYIAPASISSLSPTIGPTAGGTAVTITGSDFATSGTVGVRFGSNAATGVTVNSATQITCATPAGSAGTVDVTVTNPDLQSGTKTGAFTYLAPPSISSLSPTIGPTAGGTAVTITGSDFATSGTVGVKFGSNAATNVTANSATQITCTTPAGSAGTVDVVITNPDSQSATLTGAFTYISPPSISSLSPTSGPTAGGTAVTISGSEFATSGTVGVKFGSNAATNVTVNSATQITCTTPAGSAGAVDVVVTNPDSQSATLTGAFTYIAPPSISSLSPTSGPTAGGTSVAITGSDFAASGTVGVKFGSNAATNVTVNSATQITCTTPAGSAGTVDVVVTNPDSQSTTLIEAFSYNDPPTIGSGPAASPNPVQAGNSVSFMVSASDANGDTLSYAWDYGDATTGSGTSVTHSYSVAGDYLVSITVTDGRGGTAAASLTVTVTTKAPEAPQITSGPDASPNPVEVNNQVLLSAAAVDPDGGNVTYAWDFGDGSSNGTGGSVTHAYAAAGDYIAVVTATDPEGKVASASVIVNVTTSVGGGGGGGGGSGGGGGGGGGAKTYELTLKKLQAKLDFKTTGRDRVLAQGTLVIPEGFTPQGQTVTVDIAGVAAAFVLDPKGKTKADAAGNKNNRLSLMLKIKKNVVQPGVARFRVMLNKGDFRTPLTQMGMIDADVKKGTIWMPVQMTMSHGVYIGYSQCAYNATAGKGGSGGASSGGAMPGR